MVKEFEQLTCEERELLYKAPVLISVLMCCSASGIDKTKKRDALKLAHLRTFTAPPLLLPYYREVEKNFEVSFERTINEYAPLSEDKITVLQTKLNEVQRVVAKLDPVYAQLLLRSLKSYARHIKTSTNSVLQEIIFPMAYSKIGH